MKNSFAFTNRRTFLKQAASLAVFSIVPRHVLGMGFLAPSDQITLGFIGLGKQSGGLRNQFLKNDARIIAVCDVDQSKVVPFTDGIRKFYTDQTNKGPYKECQRYDDYRALLGNKDIDAVVVATPDHWHSAIAIAAAKAGKDIYCEKPLSLTIQEGRDMVKATRKYKRVFQTGNMQRSWNEFRQAVELVRSGSIGQIKRVNVNVGGPPRDFDLIAEPVPAGLNWDAWLGPNMIERPFNSVLDPSVTATYWGQWRDIRDFGGGGMTDWGAHMFDIAQWGLDMDHSGPVEAVPGTSGKGLVYRYANGIEMHHTPVEGKQFCHFIGTEGEVKVARGELTTIPVTLKDKVISETDKKVYFSDNHYKNFLDAMRSRKLPICDVEVARGELTTTPITLKDKLTGETDKSGSGQPGSSQLVYFSDNHYKNFLDAMRSRKLPICDVEVGHRTASVCTIGNIAYQLGRPLRWNPEKEKFDNDADANRLLSRPMRTKWTA